MMICTQCGQVYERGKFCEKCGGALTEQQPQNAPAQSAAAAETPSVPVTGQAPDAYAAPKSAEVPQPSQGAEEIPALPSMSKSWNQVKQSQVVQQGTQISKQYGTYFIKALLYPYMTSKNVSKAHLTNGLITMALIALLFPLVYYIPSLQNDIGLPFGRGYLRPFLLIAIAQLAASAVAFGVIRLGRVGSDFMTVTAKLGTLFIPALAALVLTVLSTLLKLGGDVFGFLLTITVIALIGAVTAVVLSYRKESVSGLDPLYGAIIADLVFAYILFKFAQVGFTAVIGSLFLF